MNDVNMPYYTNEYSFRNTNYTTNQTNSFLKSNYDNRNRVINPPTPNNRINLIQGQSNTNKDNIILKEKEHTYNFKKDPKYSHKREYKNIILSEIPTSSESNSSSRNSFDSPSNNGN